MQEVAVCDDRGRVSLGSEVIGKFGRRFHVVVMPYEVVLIPVAKDPLKDLAEMGKKLPKGLTIADLKRIGRERALKEAIGDSKSVQRK